jgi:hypothetical protein
MQWKTIKVKCGNTRFFLCQMETVSLIHYYDSNFLKITYKPRKLWFRVLSEEFAFIKLYKNLCCCKITTLDSVQTRFNNFTSVQQSPNTHFTILFLFKWESSIQYCGSILG